MSLTLVIGPANAAKAGFVLGAFRTAVERSASGRLPAPPPLLVVPTAADVEPYGRELAASETVFGGEVVTFGRLLALVASAAGYRERPLGSVARDRVVRAVAAQGGLEILAGPAVMPGFARAAGRLFAELGRVGVGPERFFAGMRRWGAEADPSGARYAEELARLYAAYRRRVAALGRVDAEAHAWGALDALRAAPERWGRRPVFLYGFDDLTSPQLDAVETLVRACEAPVTVSLTAERGRAALAARAATVEVLRPLAEATGGVVELPDRSEHYAPAARPALHRLERRLFEGPPDGERLSPNGAVRLLEAGGERAEAELIGAALLELVRQGAAPDDMAVLVRTPEAAPLLEQVLDAYGLPVDRDEVAPVARTRLGAGVLAGGRAALPGGTAADVLTWLRTPGRVAAPEDLDGLERAVRRTGATGADEVMRLLAGGAGDRAAGRDRSGSARPEPWPRSPAAALGALRRAATDGAAAFVDALLDELDATWTAPHRRRAAVLDADGQEDARVAAGIRAACAELRALADAAPELVGGPADVLDALADVEVRTRAATGAGVLLADPLSVRARRFRVVVLCGLQEGAFPRRPTPEPFLDDDDRRALARASGIVLPLHEDVLERERHLFYAAVSRAEEVLLLSFRSTDEDGEPQVRSPFVDDVRELFTGELWDGRGRRLLAEVTWPAAHAPTPLELRRSRAAAAGGARQRPLAPPAAAAVLSALAAREVESARGLEAFAACGVRWLVERVLRPAPIDPDPEPMQRGSLAHAVLERTLRGLRERTGSARLAPETLDAGRVELRTAIRELAGSRAGARARAALRALEVDLGRWLEAECDTGPGLEPRLLEWTFGGGEDTAPPLELAGVRVSGRVDRIDVAADGRALVRDYKGSRGHPRATWATDGHLQAALYALAARELLGLEPVGAVYQPLRGRDLRPRGAVSTGPAAAGLVDTDVVDPAAWEALLDELRATAESAAARMRAGEIRPCPERCTSRGCAYPGICRSPDAATPEERAAGGEG